MRQLRPALRCPWRRGTRWNGLCAAESDGCVRQGPWQVFWYGLDDLETAARCVEYCGSHPPSLEDPR